MFTLEDTCLFERVDLNPSLMWDITSNNECMCGHNWSEHNSFITPIPCEKCDCGIYLSEVRFYGLGVRIYV